MSPSLLILLLAIGAAFVQRVSGFGFGIFIMTVLPYIMPSYAEAVTLSGLMALVTSALIAYKMRRYLVWRKLVPILVTFVIISWFAVRFVARSDDGLLKQILGVVLILVSIYFFFFSQRVRIRPTVPMQVSMGALSGIMGGLFGMQGPPAVLYFIATAERKEEYMALCQFYFLIGNVMMSIYRYFNGFVTSTVCISWCWGMCGVFIGTWIGTRVFDLIPITVLRKVIYAFLSLSGLLILLRS